MPRNFAPTLAVLAVLAAPAAFAGERPGTESVTVDPALPSTADAVRLILSGETDFGECVPAFEEPRLDGRAITVEGVRPIPLVPCEPETWRTELALPTLDAAGYTVDVRVDGEPFLETAFAVTAPATELLLAGGRFHVSMMWSNPYDPTDAAFEARVVRLSDASGFFWFFDSGNAEVTVKVLDGRGVNGYWWVFVASNTTVDFTLTVAEDDSICGIDPPFLGPPCIQRIYHQVGTTNTNFLDVAAFAARPDDEGS